MKAWITEVHSGKTFPLELASSQRISETSDYSIVVKREGVSERHADLQVLLNGVDAHLFAASRGLALNWETSCGQTRTNPLQLFESTAGCVKISVWLQLNNAVGAAQTYQEGSVFVNPDKLGGWENYQRMRLELAGYALPMPSQPEQLPTSALFERWCFLRTLQALEKVLRAKAYFPVRSWTNQVLGTEYTSGPVAIINLASDKMLRVRHEAALMPLSGAASTGDLYILEGNSQRPLRPDIIFELLESRNGGWSLTGCLIADVKYCSDSTSTRLHRWAEIDKNYGVRIVGSAGESVVRQLWLIAPGETGISEGPQNVLVDNVTSTGDGWRLEPRGYARKQLRAVPKDDSSALFENGAREMLESLLHN